SIFSSAASTNARIAAEETPCSSGLLRGKPRSDISPAEQTDATEIRPKSTRIRFITLRTPPGASLLSEFQALQTGWDNNTATRTKLGNTERFGPISSRTLTSVKRSL